MFRPIHGMLIGGFLFGFWGGFLVAALVEIITASSQLACLFAAMREEIHLLCGDSPVTYH